MLKFLVVLYKLPALGEAEFARLFGEVHPPLAEKLPGLKGCFENFPVPDNWEALEGAWRLPEGIVATDDLKMFADLERCTWSMVEERRVRWTP